MSLVGFDHVFVRAVEIEFAPEVQYRVAPPAVLALLKVVAYMDDPEGRKKDLQDLRVLFRRYESGGDRIFANEVFEAQLPDFEFANAFLLGLDVGAMASDEEAEILFAFLEAKYISDEELAQLDPDGDRESIALQNQLRALQKGLTWNQKHDQE